VRTKKSEPFSSCVDELLRVAERMGTSKENLVIAHRLQPFAAGYFVESGPLPHSFDSNHAGVARSLQAAQPTGGIPFWNGEGRAVEPGASPKVTLAMEFPGGMGVSPVCGTVFAAMPSLQTGGTPVPPVVGNVRRCSGEDVRELSIGQLAAFWKDPAKAFLKARGIALPHEEDADDEALDRAPLSLDSLQSWGVKSAVLEEVVFGPADLSRVEAALRADRVLPPGALGSRVWQASRGLSEPLAESVKAQLGEKRSVEVLLDDPAVRITGSLLTGKDGDVLFAYRTGEMKKSKHFLEAWIQAVVAACSGSSLPTHLLDETSPQAVKVLPAIPQDEAQTILRELVAGCLEGQSRPLGFAPATSDEFVKNLAKTSDREAALAAAASKEWDDSLYGAAEGSSAAARTAWRDRDAFAEPELWAHWAEAIAAPLRNWGGFK
jgi:exonuclease V gamma subunit